MNQALRKSTKIARNELASMIPWILVDDAKKIQ